MKTLLITLVVGLFAVTAVRADDVIINNNIQIAPQAVVPQVAPRYNSPLTGTQATAAMNWTQYQLGKPYVAWVVYDSDYDVYVWIGPRYGKKMSMSRVQFESEVWGDYWRWLNR